MSSNSSYAVDTAIKVLFAVAVVLGLVSGALYVNGVGYKDGYCAALGGYAIGGARVCDVGGKVVEIPKQ